MKLLLNALSLLLVFLAVEASQLNGGSNNRYSGTCESISVKTCSSSDVLHKLTSTPITVRDGPGGGVTVFNSQKKALRGTRPYVSLLRKGKDCKKFLKPFVCAVFLPPCDDTQMRMPSPPCQELCYQAMKNCNAGFAGLGLEWPQPLDCDLFPTSLEDPQCVSAYRLSDTEVLSGAGLQTDVQVMCSYEVKPRMQPKWLKDGIPVEEVSERMRTERVNGYTTLLVISGFTDSVDRGVYTCVVEDDIFGISTNLDNIFENADGDTDCPPYTLPCPEGGKCFNMFAVCDGTEDCPSGADEADCSDGGPFPPQTCQPNELPCPSGDKCVPFSALCDGVKDCASGMDETNCTGVDPFPPQTCEPYMVPCPSGDKCVPLSALCDGVEDCSSGMDEMDCTGGDPFEPQTCEPYMVPCPSGDKCVPLSALCDGVEDCSSGMDEMDCDGREVPSGQCPPYTIACPMSEDICIPPTALCNGVQDCPSGMDEMMNCTDTETFPSLCPENTFPCPSGNKCFPMSAICDGTPDCMSGVDEMNCTVISTESCIPITVPECMVGLDYTMTIPNYPPGLSDSDKQSVLSSLSVIFDSTCGRFFRPFMCAAFSPPCRDRVVPPCRELCFLAVKKCLEAFDGILSEEDLMASGGSGGSCDMMPSEAEGACYNVEVVSIGEVAGIGSEAGVGKSVTCTYNLMPGVQPKWTDPSGSVIKTGSRRRVRVIHDSPTVTRLQIENYTSKERFGGIYTCSADDFSATVEL